MRLPPVWFTLAATSPEDAAQRETNQACIRMESGDIPTVERRLRLDDMGVGDNVYVLGECPSLVIPSRMMMVATDDLRVILKSAAATSRRLGCSDCRAVRNSMNPHPRAWWRNGGRG